MKPSRLGGAPSGKRNFVLTLGLASLFGCATPAAPPAAPTKVASPSSAAPVRVAPVTTSTVVAPAPPAPTPSAPSMPGGSDDASDSCHVAPALAQAFAELGQGQSEAAWTANARAKLLSQEDAERAFTGITQEILSALAHRRYDKLAAFAAKDGVCLRAAKGAACQTLSPRMLAGCAASGVRTEWAVDSGRDEPARYTCGEAFRHIFYARDFLHVGKPRFNCFPAGGRGNNGASLILSGPRLGYVELLSETSEGFQSLWLVFDGSPLSPELVELISEYPGI